MPFVFKRLEIQEIILIEMKKFDDPRGAFLETYKYSVFKENGVPEMFHQDNLSISSHRALRGLHYQKHPSAQAKLVIVQHGEIFDVAVDIRKGSPSYGKWVSATLSETRPSLLYIPVGFAHGFCVVSERAEVIYKVSEEYDPKNDRGIIWDDPDINIPWPVKEPLLSEKDAKHPRLKDADNNFIYGK